MPPKQSYRLLWVCLLGLLGGWLTSTQAYAQSPDLRPQLTISRERSTLRVVQNGQSADGARFIPVNSNCREQASLSTFFAPQPGFVETFVNEARIVSAIALITNPDDQDDAEVLEMKSGSLGFNELRCPVDIEELDRPEVRMYQGRTTILGQRFHYENATGLGVMDGPIALERQAAEEAPSLQANAQSMTFDVDRDLTVLRGNVTLDSETRRSEADEVEFFEDEGLAILRGNPARSSQDGDTVSGSVIEYDLNSNDVVVSRNIRATFRFDDANGSDDGTETSEDIPATP